MIQAIKESSILKVVELPPEEAVATIVALPAPIRS